jgi:hypothetical protein
MVLHQGTLSVQSPLPFEDEAAVIAMPAPELRRRDHKPPPVVMGS